MESLFSTTGRTLLLLSLKVVWYLMSQLSVNYIVNREN